MGHMGTYSWEDARKETTFFDSPALGAAPITWSTGTINVFGEPGDKSCGLLLVGDGLLSADDLPTEFFNHQLMAVNADDFDSVCDFVRMWGLPYSPYRFTPFADQAPKEARKVMRCTDKLGAGPNANWAVISSAEARHAIKCLQEMVINVWGAAMGEAYEPSIALVNLTACNSKIVCAVHDGEARPIEYGHGFPWEVERLTAAICNQIIETVADEAPWRLCAREGCGVVFKHQQVRPKASRAEKASKIKKPKPRQRVNAVCCCTACQERRKREKPKPRIDHGL